MSIGKITCCYQCPDRHATCHSSCKKYEEERKALDEFNKQRAVQKTYDMYQIEDEERRSRRRRKKR